MNKVIIMIGPSGSGKSTAAKAIKQQAMYDGINCHIVSADNYWISEGGKYEFNPSKLGFAHDYCKANFALHLATMLPTDLSHILIVDNTNTTKAERYFYELMAVEYGYEVEYKEMTEKDPEVLFARNVHNVPLDTIKKQIERIQATKKEKQ